MPKSISQLTTSPTLQEKMDASPSKLDFFGAMTDLTVAQQDNFNPGSLFATMYEGQEKNGVEPVLFDKETLQKKYDYLYRGNKELFESDYKVVKDYYDFYQKGFYDKAANRDAPVNAVSALGVQNLQKGIILYSQNNPYYDLTDTQWGKEYSPLMTTEQMADLEPFVTTKGEKIKPTLWDKLSTTWALQEVDPETNLPLDKPYWKEQSAYDEVYNKKIRSIWGPQEQYGNAVANSLGSFLSALIPETIESVGTIAKIWPTPLQHTFSKIAPVLKDSKDLDLLNTPEQYTNALISFANRLKYKPSEEAVNAGWFGSVEGFLTQFGAGLAYILPQRGVAAGGAKLLMNAGLKMAASKGLTGDAAKVFANNFVSKNVASLTTSTALIGTGQMMGMNYRAAREAGLSKDDAALMTWAASPMIFLTEKLISSPYLIKGLVQYGPDLKKVIAKEVAHELQQTGGKMTEQAALNIAVKSSKWLIDKVGQGGKFLIKSPVTEGAVREGTQESLEEAGYVAMENIYDIGFADKDAVKGKGKYGTEFFSEETLNRVGESFIGGAVLGGFMDAMSGGFKRKEQEDTFATVFATGKEKDLKKIIEDGYKKGNLGYSHLDSSGSVMDYASKKSDGIKNHNDLVYDTLMQKYNLYKSVKEELGINSPAFMEKVEGDVSIVKEALNNGLQQKEIGVELEEKEKQLAEAKATGSETKGLEEEIKTLHTNLTGLKTSFDDILSGKRIADKTKQNLVSHFYEGNKDYVKAMSAPVVTAAQVDEFSSKLSEDKKLYKEALIQEKAKGVEVRNTYDDSIKALEDANPEQLDANFFTALSNLKTQIDKYGIETAKGKKLLGILEKKKAELLKSAEGIFEAEELKAMQQSSMIDEAIDEGVYMTSITQGLQQKNKMEMATSLSNLLSQDFLPSQKTIQEAEESFKENENAFVNEYYTSYVPVGQENSYSMNKVLDDVMERVVNGQETDTDIKAIEEIKQAAGVKAIIASLQKNVYGKIPEKYVRLPKDGLPTLEQNSQLADSFGEIYNKINFLEMMVGQNKLDRQNRQTKIKTNDIAIRFKLAEMIHPNITDEKVSSAVNTILDRVREDRQKMIAAIKDNKFDDELIAKVYAGVIEAEAIIHSELNKDPDLMKRALVYAKGTWNLETIAGGYENPIEFKNKSFDSLYDHTFFDSVGSLTNPSDKVFATLVFINNLLTLQRGNPYDFYTRYGQILSTIKTGDSIPSYEQQQLIRHIDSFLQNSDNSFIKEAKNIIRPKSKEAATRFYLNNSLFVRGYAGAGKTQMIAKSTVEMLALRLGRKVNVAVVAPGINLAASLASSISRATGESKTYTLEDFISKGEEVLDGSDLVIFDEASMISEEQLDQLDKIINGKHNVPSLMLGDQSQMPPMTEKQFTDAFVHVAVEDVMERTLPVTEIYRTGVDSIWSIQSALRNAMFSEQQLLSWPITTYNAERTQGVEYVNSNNPTEILNIFKNDFSEPSRRTSTALIFLTKQERADAINKLMQDTDFVSRVSAEAINSSVFHMEGGVGSVLGHEFDNVYVGFSQTEQNKNIYSRAVLTAVTRAKSYVALLNTQGKSRIGEVLKAQDLSSEEKAKQKEKELAETKFITGNKTYSETKEKEEIEEDEEFDEQLSFSVTDPRILKLISDSKFFKLTEDGNFYIDTREKGKLYKRVTSVVTEFDEGAENKKLVKSSIEIGNKVDAIVRDFFDGNLKSFEYYKLSTNKNVFDNFVNYLKTIQDTIKRKGGTIISKNIIVHNRELGLAGTIDLLYINKNGEIVIYDVKTMRGNNFKDFYEDETVAKYDSKKYGKSKRQKHQEQLSLYNILLKNTYGISASSIAVLPFETKYNAGDTTTSLIKPHPSISFPILTSVEGYEIKTPIKKAGKKKSQKSSVSDKEANFLKKGQFVVLNPAGEKVFPALKGVVGKIVRYKAQHTYETPEGYERTEYRDTDEKTMWVVFAPQQGDPVIVNKLWLDAYKKPKSKKTQPAADQEPPRDYSWKYSEGMGIMRGDLYSDKLSDGNIVEPVNVYRQNDITYVEMSDGHSEPLNSFWKRYERSSGRKAMPKNPTDYTFFAKKYNSSAEKLMYVNTFASAEAGKQTENAHSKIKLALLSQIAQSTKSKYARKEKANIYYHKKYLLNTGTELKEFNNVLVLRYPDAKHVASVASSIGIKITEQEVLANGYDVLGVFHTHQTSADLSKPSADNLPVEYNEALANKYLENVKKGFEGHENAAALTDYNFALIKLRSIGSSHPQGFVGQVAMAEFGAGTLVAKTGTANDYQPMKALIKDLQAKGFYVSGNVYMDTQAYKTASGENRPAMILEVSAGKGLPVTRVFVDSPYLFENKEEIKEIQQQLQDMKKQSGLNKQDIESSRAYKTLNFNRSLLHINGKFHIPALESYLRVRDNVFINTKASKDDIAGQLNALIKAFDVIAAEIERGNPRATRLYAVAFKENSAKGLSQYKITEESAKQLKTRVTDVYYPQLYVSLASVFKNNTSDIQGDSASEKKDNLMRSLLGNMKNNMRDDINRAKSKPSMNDAEVRESREEVIKYYEKVFGKDFLARRLEFAPRVTLNGKELYGLVANAKAILEETEAGIKTGTKRHEAVHLVLNYILDEESKNKILNAVKQIIAADRGGISTLSITDEVADEWLANKYETEYEDPKSLIGKFLHWLKRVFRGMKTHGSVIDELLYNIEFGKYKDEEFSDADADITRTKEKEDYEEYSDEDSEQEKGYVKKKHKFSKTGKGLASIGKLTGLQAKEFGKKKQFKYGDYNNLKAFFGSADAVNIARKNVAEVLLKSSNYNANIEDEPKTIKETISTALRIFKENADTINTSVGITTDNGERLNTFNDINETNLHYLNADQQMEYFYWRMGNEGILLRLIQKTFPSINIYKLINSDEAAPIFQENDEFVDMTLEDQLFMFHENTIREGVETRNFTDTISPFVKWNLETLRLKDGSFVNIVKMHKILVDGFSNAKEPTLASLRESLEAIMGNTTTESDVKDHVEAFINRFLNNNLEVEDKANFSHIYLESNYKEISNQYPDLIASIGAKAQYSSSLLNAIVHAYGSIVPKSYVKWRITSGINSESIFPSVNDSDDWKNRISEMLSTSFEFNDAGVQLSEKFVETIKGDNRKYDITEKGISLVDGTPIINFITKGGALNAISMAPGVTAREIKMLMNNIGVKISLPAIKTFLFGTENTSLLGDPNYSYTPNRLAEIIAAWYLSSANLLAKQEGTTSFAGPFIGQYYAKMGINPTSLNEAVKTDENIEISDQAKTEELVVKPQDFFVLNRNLAKAQAYATGNGNIRHYFGVDGKKIYIDTPSGTAYNYFGTSGDTENASDHIKENPQDILRGNPALIRQGTILNPYLDSNSSMTVISMNVADGVENSNRGRKIGKMTRKDYIAVSVNSFINSAIASFNKSEQLQIPGQNISDKSKQYVWKVRFASSDEPNAKFIIRQGDKVFLNTTIVLQNISKMFIYHENSRDLSLQKWFNFLSSIPNVNISQSDLEVWKENPQQLNGILANLSANLPGFRKMVEKSGLILTKDFLLSTDGTTIAAGKATIFNIDDIFNLDNYRKLKEATDKVSLIRELFEERFMNMAAFFSASGYQHVPDHLNLAGFDSSESYYKRNQDGSVLLNPFFEGFMYAYTMNNHFTTQIIQGDSTLFSDLPDFFKRAAGPDAPMQKFRTDSKFGIGKTSLVAIINDTFEVNQEVVEVLKKRGYDEASALKIATVKTQDGIGLLNPIMQELMKKSSGAEAGSMGNGMYKPVYFKQGLYFKYALLPLSAQTIENSPLAKSYFDKMFLSEDLRNKFYEYAAQDGFDFAVRKTAYDIAVSGRQNEVVGQLVFKSAVKSGAHKINDLEDESWETVEIDNDFFGLQLNPEQDINDTEIALPTQILAQVGVGQTSPSQLERIKNINETQKTIATIQTKAIFDDILSQEGRDIREKFFAYLKKMGLKASEQMGEVGQIVDMLNNRAITPDLPILRTKLIQMFGNKITKNAIKPSMNGVRMNQAPSFFFDIFDYQGQVMMWKDLRAIGLSDEQINKLPKRGLKPNEIIIPFSYVAQFGISPDMSVHQAREFITANSPEKLQAFESLLTVIFARTPASAPSGAGIGKVVGWINDNSNTIYISSAKNVLDGSDFDIDQLSVFFNYVDEQGSLPAQGTVEFYQNKLLGLVMDYYNDPENYEITHTPTSLTELKNSLKEKEDKDPSLKSLKTAFGKFNDFSSNAYMYEQIHSGKDITGIAANANKAYSFLNQAINVNNARSKAEMVKNMISGFDMAADGKTDTGKFVIQFLSELLNASVDNAKELILGAFNVGLINANSLMAMVIRGYDSIQALSFFQNPEILAAINDVYVRQSITPLLTRDGQIVRGGQNKFGKPYTLADAIHNQITRLQNEPVVPVTAERIAELENILSEIDPQAELLPGEGINIEELTAELSMLRQDLPNAMNEAATYRTKQIKNLQDFLDHVYLGEQIRRMTKILSLNVNGIPVFDYEMDKLIEDIEFALNQNLEDYLSGLKQKNPEWYLSKKSFLSPEELLEEKAKEKAIRKFINIGAVIDTLPHIKEYLNILYTIREFYLGSTDNKGSFTMGFLRNSPLVKEIFNRFFESKKINFPSEKKYYAFYNQLEKFFIALYFNQKYRTAILPSTTSLITGSEMIDISTPQGRYRYGMEFPQFVSNLMDEIKSNDELKDHVGNKFLNRLSYDKNDTIGPLLELRDGASLNEQQKADIISDFNKLDQIQPELKEKFALYHLMKDGFVFRQNSIGQVMDSSIFAGFNSFLDELSIYAKQDANEEEVYLDLGNGKSSTLFDILDDVFLADVGTYETDLLDYYNESWTEDTRPDQYKEGKRYGIYNSIGMVKSNNPQVIYKGKYLDRFNPYNPAESTITSGQTFKRMSYEKYSDFKKGHNVVIKNANARGYSNGTTFLSDGTVVELVIDKKKNQITIKHKNPNVVFSVDDEGLVNKERLENVNYTLKTVAILTSERGKAIIEKGKKNNWSIDKVLQEAQVPKEQAELLKQQEGNTIEDKLVNFVANYSQVIEINVAIENLVHDNNTAGIESIWVEDRLYKASNLSDEYYILEKTENGKKRTDISKEQFLKDTKNYRQKPTQIHKNLTAHGNTKQERPYTEGDWEYKEFQIQVPNIELNEAARKHEPFNTGHEIAYVRASFNKKTGEVVIHEIQSDPFQDNVKKTFDNESRAKDEIDILKQTYNDVTIKKIQEGGVDKWQVTGRERKNLTTSGSNTNNQFLQLLNQKDNWVKFITQSIIQYAAKQEVENKKTFHTFRGTGGIRTESKGLDRLGKFYSTSKLVAGLYSKQKEVKDKYGSYQIPDEDFIEEEDITVNNPLIISADEWDDYSWINKYIDENVTNKYDDWSDFPDNIVSKLKDKLLELGYDSIIVNEDKKRSERIRRDEGEERVELIQSDYHGKQIIVFTQQSAKQGFTTIKFPTGNTAVKIEGGSIIEEFKKEKEDRIKELEKIKQKRFDEIPYVNDELIRTTQKLIDKNIGNKEENIKNLNKYKKQKEAGVDVSDLDNQINRLKQELKTLEEQGLTGTFGGVFKFYEEQLKNVLNKAGYDPKLITDEYGNTWWEVAVVPKMKEDKILFSQQKSLSFLDNMSKYFDNDRDNLRKYSMSSDKREILRMIANNSNLSHFRTLANLLLNMPSSYVLARGNVKLMDTKTEYRFTVPNSGGLVANAFFELDSQDVYMNLDKIKSGLRYEATLLHELMHQLTLAVFRKDRSTMTAPEIEFVDDITSLYNEAKNALTQSRYYGLTNIGEFISEAFVNPEFQKALAGVKSKMKDSPSLWDRFVNALTGFINRMFPEGISAVPNSVLEKVIKTTSDYVVGKVESINFGNEVSDFDVENKLKECL